MTMNDFILKAMNMPFVEKGRDYEGCDCFGLVWLGFRDVLGITLPKHTDEYEDAGTTTESRAHLGGLVVTHKREWEQVKNPSPMDVVLFRLAGQPIHVGLMIDKKNFIHSEKKRGVSIESVNDIRWTLRKEGVYKLCRA
jgi:cell wall-associated NlpC family hydrolase